MSDATGSDRRKAMMVRSNQHASSEQHRVSDRDLQRIAANTISQNHAKSHPEPVQEQRRDLSK